VTEEGGREERKRKPWGEDKKKKEGIEKRKKRKEKKGKKEKIKKQIIYFFRNRDSQFICTKHPTVLTKKQIPWATHRTTCGSARKWRGIRRIGPRTYVPCDVLFFKGSKPAWILVENYSGPSDFKYYW
jgi:hypothetical protein